MLGIAKHSESLEDFVVYECLYDNKEAKIWIRPQKMFDEKIEINGKKISRFQPVLREEAQTLAKCQRESQKKVLTLVPMTQTDYEEFYFLTTKLYATSRVESGNWKIEDAQEKSEREHKMLLPNGLDTPGHFLFKIHDLDKYIGTVWLCYKSLDCTVFIYDLYFREECRQQGYGRNVLDLIESKAKELGAAKLALHVFGFNKIAIHLYESCGFEPTNISMQKKIV